MCMCNHGPWSQIHGPTLSAPITDNDPSALPKSRASIFLLPNQVNLIPDTHTKNSHPVRHHPFSLTTFTDNFPPPDHLLATGSLPGTGHCLLQHLPPSHASHSATSGAWRVHSHSPSLASASSWRPPHMRTDERTRL